MAEAEELLEIKQRLALIELRLEQLFEHANISPREALSPDSGEVSERVRALVAEGKTEQAIKVHRDQTGAKLAEAKETIERLGG